ncbi:GcrA family cell cycle regulator [Microvirga arsenatis]|uniref:GcrA cell cycle regulator n=1 Tax=Microvirga arsenatis TaxID=2692265 RepID=A0ABW9Z192_9HYPH|nr:GcrA family cell cycle regulator [Microvirga arsenatis]NBJ12886.1 GcrA cell cycle regulator [Microvirga arsenatis]NBJ25721.1 GcrA cell cycle regulator [Microvirga arsenatis]
MIDAGATWTDERVELLKKLWTDGLSASQIAAELGNVTRNAVIGKVHRLGLSGRAKDAKPAAAAAARPRKATRAPSAPAPLPPQPHPGNVVIAPVPLQPVTKEPEVFVAEEDVAIPMSERVTIMDLRESMCRWPMGDPTKPEFRFCGARSITGLPYCTHHARIAYQPVADRKRERKLARA